LLVTGILLSSVASNGYFNDGGDAIIGQCAGASLAPLLVASNTRSSEGGDADITNGAGATIARLLGDAFIGQCAEASSTPLLLADSGWEIPFL
jgi:hypothetical protein